VRVLFSDLLGAHPTAVLASRVYDLDMILTKDVLFPTVHLCVMPPTLMLCAFSILTFVGYSLSHAVCFSPGTYICRAHTGLPGSSHGPGTTHRAAVTGQQSQARPAKDVT